MNSLSTFDVVVVGGGVVGASAAYFAARLGASVAIVEKGIPGQEASGRNAGGVRQQGRARSELPLAKHSVKLWQFFRDERGGQFEYVQDGNLYLALTEAEVDILKAAAVRQQRDGLPVTFLAREALRELAPALSDRILGANYCPTDGQANPILATRFLLREALRAGVSLYDQTRVTAIEVGAGRVRGVRTDRGRIECRAVIAAAGAWVADLCRPLGVELPIIARRTQICVTTPLPRILRQFVSGNTVYIRQSMSGNLFLGGGGNWEALGYRKDTSFHSLHRFVARSADLLPAVRQTSILRTWAGTLDITPDGAPLVGPVPSVEGLVVAVGYCGHGFALGPGSGDVTARLALGMEPGVDVSGLAPDRFPAALDFPATYQPVAEPAP